MLWTMSSLCRRDILPRRDVLPIMAQMLFENCISSAVMQQAVNITSPITAKQHLWNE